MSDLAIFNMKFSVHCVSTPRAIFTEFPPAKGRYSWRGLI